MKRQLMLLGLVVLVGAATPASAGPRPSCNLVRDALGDDEVGAGGAGSGTSESLDVASADVASDSNLLTAVIRVKQLTSPDPGSPTGTWHVLRFSGRSNRFHLDARHGPDGTFYTLHRAAITAADGAIRSFEFIANVDGLYDEDASEVRITAPLSLFRRFEPMRSGTNLGALEIKTWRRAGHEGGPVFSENGVRSDAADGGATTYRLSTKSCVRVGA